MHLYYLDESGCCGKVIRPRRFPVFSLSGFSISDEKWKNLYLRYLDIEQEYQLPKGFDFEIKGSDFFETSYLPHLNADRKALLIGDLLTSVADNGSSIILAGFDCAGYHLKAGDTQMCPYLKCLRYILQKVHKECKTSRTKMAFVILDEKQELEEDVCLLFDSVQFHQTKKYRCSNIAAFGMQAKSKFNVFVQLADLIASITRWWWMMSLEYTKSQYFSTFSNWLTILNNRIKTPRKFDEQLLPHKTKEEKAMVSLMSEYLLTRKAVTRRRESLGAQISIPF